jgi:beta-phosphoglucomutase family hydrolase
MITITPETQALIFDCDGTLADSMPLHYLAWQETVNTFGGQFPEKLFYDTGGMPSEQIVTILNEMFGYQFDPHQIAAEKETCFLQHVADIKPIQPVVAIAKEYHGRLPMAVATGGILNVAQHVLGAIGLASFFDTIVTREDVTHGKPAPDTFLEAARRLKADPRYCLVFEDSDAGLEAARRAGMQGIDIRPWRG